MQDQDTAERQAEALDNSEVTQTTRSPDADEDAKAKPEGDEAEAGEGGEGGESKPDAEAE